MCEEYKRYLVDVCYNIIIYFKSMKSIFALALIAVVEAQTAKPTVASTTAAVGTSVAAAANAALDATKTAGVAAGALVTNLANDLADKFKFFKNGKVNWVAFDGLTEITGNTAGWALNG